MLDRRGRLLLVTVGAALLPLLDEPAVRALHGWLDTWRGIGPLEAGMARQGYDLQSDAVRRRHRRVAVRSCLIFGSKVGHRDVDARRTRDARLPDHGPGHPCRVDSSHAGEADGPACLSVSTAATSPSRLKMARAAYEFGSPACDALSQTRKHFT